MTLREFLRELRAIAGMQRRLEGTLEDLRLRLERLEARSEDVRLLPLLTAGRIARALETAKDPLPPVAWRPAEPEAFEATLERLRALEPRAFPIWMELFENGARSYVEEREASCSHRQNPYAEAFRAFISLHGRGRILDLGCGIYGRPSYLEGIRAERISAIEPLEMAQAADFEVARGVAEFLPWPDRSFHTVVCATSLDHVLSLDRALAEIHRVLVDGGRFLVWIASIAGSPAYEPGAPDVKAIDSFHLFHFDRTWFEPMVGSRFRIVECEVFPTPSFDHVFYSVEARAR